MPPDTGIETEILDGHYMPSQSFGSVNHWRQSYDAKACQAYNPSAYTAKMYYDEYYKVFEFSYNAVTLK